MLSDNRHDGSKKRPAPSSEAAAAAEVVVVLALSRDAYMDSLPYVDVVHDDYEQYALALIEEEMKTPSASKHDTNTPRSRSSQLPPVQFRTPALEHEYQRCVEASDGGSSRLEPMPSNDTVRPPKGDDSEEWRTAVQHAKAGYEAERARSMALEAKKDVGAALLWKGLNGTLDQTLATMQSSLAAQRQRVEQINLQRSQDQQAAGQQIHILTNQYQTALERRFQLQQATVKLEQEMQQQEH